MLLLLKVQFFVYAQCITFRDVEDKKTKTWIGLIVCYLLVFVALTAIETNIELLL